MVYILCVFLCCILYVYFTKFVFAYRAQSVENLGLAVVALLAGIIVDIEGYYMVELFFCLLLSGESYNVFLI